MAEHYVAAWTLVHLLLTNDAYTPAFGKYLDRIHDGASEALAAWQETVGRMSAQALTEDYQRALVPQEVMLVRAKWVAPPYAAENNRPMTSGEVHVLWAQLRPETPVGRAAAQNDLTEAVKLGNYSGTSPWYARSGWRRHTRFLRGRGGAARSSRRYSRIPRIWNVLGRLTVQASIGTTVGSSCSRRRLRTSPSTWPPSRRARRSSICWRAVSAMQGNPDAALTYEKRAVAVDPNCVPCLAEAARIFYGKGRVREALETATLALGLLPEKQAHASAERVRGDLPRAPRELDGISNPAREPPTTGRRRCEAIGAAGWPAHWPFRPAGRLSAGARHFSSAAASVACRVPSPDPGPRWRCWSSLFLSVAVLVLARRLLPSAPASPPSPASWAASLAPESAEASVAHRAEDRSPEILGRILDAEGNPSTTRPFASSPRARPTPFTARRGPTPPGSSRSRAFPYGPRVSRPSTDPDGIAISAELAVAQGQTTELTLVLSAASTLRGTVVDGTTIPSRARPCRSRARRGSRRRTTSDAAGAFRLTAVPLQASSLVAVARGYKTARVALVKRDDGTELTMRVRLAVAAVVEGDVRDPAGNPVKARVVACEGQAAEARAVSADDGTFQLPSSTIGCDAVAEHDEYGRSDAVAVLEASHLSLRLRASGCDRGRGRRRARRRRAAVQPRHRVVLDARGAACTRRRTQGVRGCPRRVLLGQTGARPLRAHGVGARQTARALGGHRRFVGHGHTRRANRSAAWRDGGGTRLRREPPPARRRRRAIRRGQHRAREHGQRQDRRIGSLPARGCARRGPSPCACRKRAFAFACSPACASPRAASSRRT